MASITVDIKAQITGYQEQINKMKSELAKIDLGSNIGKSLQRSIETAQKQLNALSKTPMPKLSSESGIESLTNKLVNVNEMIQNIGQEMQKVNFGDLNLDALHQATSELVTELNNARQQLSQNVDLGFQDAIKSVPELSNLFKQMGQDINALSAEQGKNALAAYAEETKQKAEEAAVALNQLKNEQQALQSEVDSKKAPDSFISRLQTSLQQLSNQKVDVDQVLNTDVIKQSVDKWIAQIDRLTGSSVTNEAGAQLKNIIESYFDLNNLQLEADPDAIRAHVTNFINEFSNAFRLLGGQGGQTTLKTIFGEQLDPGKIMKNFLQVDPQEIEAIRNNLRSIFKDFSSEEVTGKDTKKFFKFIDDDQLEKALNEAVNIIKEKLQKAQEELQKQEEELNRKNTEVATATTTESEARALATNTSDASVKVNEIIRDLKIENQKLSQRVTALEAKLRERAEQTLSEIHNTGRSGSDTAKSELPELAKNAQMYKTELDQVLAKEKLVGKIEGVVQRWFSIYAAVRMVGNAIRSVISTIQELDKTITEIAIVTDMTQQDLWGQMSSYTDMARQYASSISGVYQVSQLYYQQGLQTADVMTLTEQTLKMARISGLGYAEATDFMTNAVRSFKMEMTEAQRVVDVYSAVAASSATSTTELANAMSKTASSAESVGSSFENTTAMMAVMIEATRESAENIGSAMKSIISRYGEMTSDPTKVVDSEGQEMSLNRVDKALQTVGISIHDAAGQFRDFDDVITELAGKWDTIDANTQRYIATIMAGNRQQSRFLALVSNGERLTELSEEAANSQDAATLQVLKTMDSIEAKSQQLKTSLQSLYTTTGVQNLFKGFLDVGNQIVKTFTQMPTIFSAPIPAILKIGTTFASLSNVVTTVFSLIKTKLDAQHKALTAQEQAGAQEREIIYTEETLTRLRLKAEELNQLNALERQGTKLTEDQERRRTEILREAEQERQNIRNGNTTGGITKKAAGAALGLNIAGVALSTVSGIISDKTQSSKFTKGLTGVAGSALSMAGMGTMIAPGIGTGIGAALGAVMGIVENINYLFESAEARAQRLKEAATEANNTYLQKKDDYRSLDEQIKKIKELEKARYDSVEANEAYLQASNELASSYPELIGYIDQEGNAIVNLANTYDVLANARLAAQQAAVNAAETSAQEAEDAYNTAVKNRNKNRSKSADKWLSGQLTEQELETWSAAGIDTDSLPAKTRKNLLSSISSKLVDVGFAGDDQINDDYALLAQINQSISSGQADLDFFNKLITDNKDDLQKIKSNNPDDELIQAYFSLIEGLTGNLLSIEQDISQKSNVVDATNKTAVANATYWASQAKLMDKKENADFLKEFDTVNEVISSYVNSQFDVFKTKNTDKEGKPITAFAEGETWYSRFKDAEEGGLYQSYEVIYSQIQKLWNDLATDAKQNDFNKLIATRDIYSFDQFASIIKEKYGITPESELGQSLLQYYDTAFNSEDFYNAITSRENAGSKLAIPWDIDLTGLLDTLSGSELQKILGVYDDIQNQIENQNISQNLGQSLLDGYFKIWDVMNFEHWDNGSLEEAQALLLDADLFSLSGLEDFRKAIESSNLSSDKQQKLMELAQGFTDLVPQNLITGFASFQQNVKSGMEDFEKALSNASKGMDYKTASELAQKIGKDVTDFDFKGGKYFATDYFEEIQKAYVGQDENLHDALQNRLTTEIENLESLSKAVLAFGDDKTGYQLVQAFTQDNSADLRSLLELNLEKLPEGLNIDAIVAAYDQYLTEVTDGSQDFITWYSQELTKETDSLEQYITDLNARAELSAGNFSNFLKAVITPDKFQQDAYRDAMQALQSGDIDTVLAMFPEYASDILKYYKDINKSVYDQLVSGFDSTQYITTNDFNKDALADLEELGLIEKISEYEGEIIYKTLEDMTEEDLNKLSAAIQTGNFNKSDKDKWLAAIYKEKYEDNMYDALSGVADTYDNISYEAAQALVDALKLDSVESSGLFSIDSAGKISASYEKLRSELNIALFNNLIDKEQYNKIRAQLEEQKTKLDTDNIINNIISKRDQITTEGVAQLANAFNITYNSVIDMLDLRQNDDGTYTMSIATLWNNFKDRMNDATRQYVAGQIDNVISSITGLSGSQSKGFTNLAEMQKYVSELNKLGVTTAGDEALDFRTLFEYDNTLHAYRLSTQGLIAQIGGMQSQLAELTGEEKEIAEQLIADTTRQFAEQIDAESVIDAIGTNQISLARTNFRKAVEDYNSVLTAMAEVGESVELLDAEALLNNLHAGGLQAVEAMTEIARIQGQKITADQAESAYRSKVSQYIDAIDQLVAKPGEIVDQTTADIISAAGGQVAQLSNSGSYLVQSAANLYQAYKDLLEKMRGTGEATLADLNKVAGAMLDNKDGEQQVIDALGDAAGLTYSRFGEILTTAGYQLTKELVQQLESSGVIQSLGGNKMRITDFKAFVDLMNWDADSQEYVSAFKAYNDSLIEMNRQTEKNILEEASKLKDLQGGDWLNLTQLSEVLNKQVEKVTQQGTNAPKITTALDTLNNALISYGGYLENGILKTVEGADIPSIIKLITDNIQQYGALSEAELAQLADMLKEVLKSYADAISSGIKGTLSNESAQKLSQWAESAGIGKLNFSETTQGLKLSTEQAYELYKAISQIDGLQGRLVFKELQDSLSKAKGGDFYGATAALAAPKRVQQEINAVAKEQAQIYEKIAGNRATESDQKRLAVLERQKANLESQKNLYGQLSKEMAYANMDNPDSYNFMDNKLPDTFQGPINYWNSIGKAYTAMNEAGQTGKMEIQDFYNIVNEMSNLAALSGDSISFMGQEINGDLTSASKLIQAGFSSLSNVDGKGVKIDMGKLAANLQTGAEDMGKGFDAAIKDMARSQIDMITAMIRVLETVQAMEQLGQVDVDNNGILSVGEIFEDDGSFTEMYDQVRDFLLNSEALQPMLEDLKVNGIKLKDLLSEDQTAWREAGVSQQQYAEIMSAFYQAAISDNYDLDNLISSVLNVLSGTGQIFSYYDKETGVETVIDMTGKTYKINWNDEKDKKNIYDAFEKSGYWKTHDKPGDTEKLDETIREVLDKGQQGTLTGEALVAYDLAYNIITEYTTGEGENTVTTYKDSKGNEYPTPQEAVVGNILATQKAEQISKIQEIEVDGQTFKTGIFRVKGGMEYKVEVDTETGETTYTTTTADGSHVSGKTREEMIHNLLERESRIESHGAFGIDDRSEEDIIRLKRKLGIEVIPEAEFKNAEGKIFNPADDPDFQQKLTSFVNQSHEQIQKALESNMTKNTDDTYTFTLFDGNTITVKAENEKEALAKAEEQAKATANSMIPVISAAIKSAFTEDDSIGQAIGNGIKDALASDDTPVTDSTTQGETKSVKIPKLSVEVDTMEITGVTNFAFPKGDNAVANTSDVTIPKMSATIDTLTIDKVNNDPTFAPAKEDESSNVIISSMTSTVDDLTVNEIKKSHYDSTLKLSDDITNGEANVTNMAVGATNFTATGSLLALQGMNFATTSTSLSNIASATGKIGKASFSNFDILSTRLSTIKEQVDTIWSTVQQFADKTFTVNMNTNTTTTTTTNSGGSNKSSGGNSSGGGDSGLSKIFGSIASTIGSIFASGKNSASVLSPVADALKNIGQRTASGTVLNNVGSYLKTIATSGAPSKVRSLADAMSNINDVSTKVKRAADALSNIPESKSMSVRLSYSTTRSSAKGNIGNFAQAKGSSDALSKGRKTLMGELGPELVVTNGHYYVVGQNGAEFVNLAKDAIVFNHKQTKRLLEQGMIGSRGKPVTNEANAISFAKGSISDYGIAKDKGDDRVFPRVKKPNAKNPYEIKESTGTQDEVTGEEKWRPQTKTQRLINTALAASEKISSVTPVPDFHEFKLFSYAKGNVGSMPHGRISGPAKGVGTSAALSALYQLLAMWQSLLNASAKDLGAMGGAGRGGGGGGGGGNKEENAAFIKELEIWYNLLRQIAKLEKDITYEVSKQKVLLSDQVINGKEIYNSYKEEYNYLIQSAEKNRELSNLQQDMYIAKKDKVNASPWGKLFHYDEYGLMQMNTDLTEYVKEQSKNNLEYFDEQGRLRTKVTSYVRDENGAVVTNKKGKEKTTTRTVTLDLEDLPTSTLDFFSLLNATDENGAAVYTAEEQVAMLKAFGFGDLIKYDSKGKKIDESSKDAATKMVETFWNRYDALVKDVDSSFDAFKDSQNQALEQQAKANELIQKIVDNQIEVEQTVYNAIVDREQALIDEIQDERDALSKSNEKFLQGLNDALTKEQNMYQQQDEKNELTKLQRQLNILQRSGGSASQIRSLQEQISSKQRDMYFNEQQRQIDAIQEASDKEIERLDAQIDLMTETLEYEKEHGLLWNEVYSIMQGTPEQIMDFITTYSKEFMTKSATDQNKYKNELGDKIEIYTESRDAENAGKGILNNKNPENAQKPQSTEPKILDEPTIITEPEKEKEEPQQTETESSSSGTKVKIHGQYYAHNKANLKDSSRFKANPNDKNNFIFGVKDKNTTVDVLGYSSNGMYYVRQNGVEGWISGAAFSSKSSKEALAEAKKNKTIKKYKKGGLIDYTGLAWVDGSKAKPETVLNAKQTAQLKGLQDVNSLNRSLAQITAMWDNLQTEVMNRNYNNEQETIVIEKAEVNMNVSSIANDYDARRAGDMALAEMMKIARKTGKQGVKRR